MSTENDAKELAENVIKFINHNNIDITKFTMDEIVKEYFNAQLRAIDAAGTKILNNSEQHLKNMGI